MSFQFFDIQQNTDEWLDLRSAKPTSSALSKIMANYGKDFGKPAKDYAVNICLERITGKPVSGGYSNEHMARGHEQEPIAKMLYEQEYFCTVDNGGFFDWDFFGCSPDGLVNNDGVVEIKSAIPSIHFERIRKGSFDSSYKWQLVANMKFTCRDWIDFISYCADFPEDKKLYVVRLYASEHDAEFKKIDERLDQFFELIEKTEKTILNNPYFIDEAA
jgi:hypothetical protein